MNTRSFIWNTLHKGKYFLFASILEKGAYFLVYIYLARTSSIQVYGDIAAAFVFANILNSLLEFGFAPYFQRESAFKRQDITGQLNAAMMFKMINFALYALIAAGYFSVVGTKIPAAVLLIVISIYITSFSEVFSRVLFGLDNYKSSFYSLLRSRIVLFAGIGLLIALELSYVTILIFLFFSVILQSMLLVRELRKNGIILRPMSDSSTVKKILITSVPMGIGILFVWMYDKIDVLLINHYLGSESVSFYAVAYSLYKMPQMITGVILVPLYTSFSNRFNAAGTLFFQDILKPGFILTIAALLMIAAFNIFPEIFIRLTYGEKYSASSWILGFLAFAIPAIFLNNLTGVTLNAVRNERQAMYSAFYAFVLNITLNILFIPKIGLLAAVLATIASEYGILLIQVYYLKKSKRILWHSITS